MLRVLELQNIRSYKNGLFEFAPGVNIIVGSNASGKTNLLEAVHMVARGSGFKSSDMDMVRYEQEWGRVDATFNDRTRAVKLKTDPLEKTFIIDDVEKKRLPDSSYIPTVLFEPNHMLLLGGEPERRRSYIDGILVQTEIGYKKTLQAYKRTLAQRNRLLKQEYVSAEHLFVWDVRLSELAGVLAAQRVAYIDIVNKDLMNNYRSVSGVDETLEVFYDTKLPLKGYTESHLQKLQEDFELDHARGFTGSGPHRDDLGIVLNGSEARASASRGETRSIVLALKIAELKIVRQQAEQEPLLLLDDVFSELDGKRRRMLAQSLQDTQTLITTTDADAVIQGFLQSYTIITTTK